MHCPSAFSILLILFWRELNLLDCQVWWSNYLDSVFPGICRRIWRQFIDQILLLQQLQPGLWLEQLLCAVKYRVLEAVLFAHISIQQCWQIKVTNRK